jgi:hypothetical protein
VEIFQAGAVGLLLGSLLAGRAHPRRPIFVANLGLATYALPLALFAAALQPSPLSSPTALALAGLGFLNPVWQTSVQAVIPPGVPARVTSYDWLQSLGAVPLGYVLTPLAASAWGPRAPLWGRGRGGRGLRRNCRHAGRPPLPGHGQRGQLPHTGDHRQ